MKNISNFKKYLYGTIILAITLVSCNKNEDLYYQPIGYIEGLEVLDIYPLDDTILIVAGKTNYNEGKIYRYNTLSKTFSGKTFEYTIHDISANNNGMWACGDSMNILYSTDNGFTWNSWKDFSYFWTVDRTNLKEIYFRNSLPIYAIGTKNMLNGNLYSANLPQFPLKSKQLQMGVNDMALVDSTSIYVACYGSILKVTEDGENIITEKIGGENFTGITTAGSQTVLTCTDEGNIYKYESYQDSWGKVLETRKHFKFIQADNYGNVLAIAESSDIYVSNNYGSDWKIKDYKLGKKVSSAVFENNVFYLGTSDGQIIKLTRSDIER